MLLATAFVLVFATAAAATEPTITQNDIYQLQSFVTAEERAFLDEQARCILLEERTVVNRLAGMFGSQVRRAVNATDFSGNVNLIISARVQSDASVQLQQPLMERDVVVVDPLTARYLHARFRAASRLDNAPVQPNSLTLSAAFLMLGLQFDEPLRLCDSLLTVICPFRLGIRFVDEYNLEILMRNHGGVQGVQARIEERRRACIRVGGRQDQC